MKKNIFIILLFFIFLTAQAQIGIGTSSPDKSAVLELKSTTKGFLPPCLTTTQRDAIVSPAVGLMIYNSSKNCLEWYDGAVWYSGCGIQESSGGTAVVSSYNCAAASAGVLTQGSAVSGVTQRITAVVEKAGTYAVSAAANGIIFTGSGIFTAAGAQDVLLSASGTPLAEETSNFILNTAVSCDFDRAVSAGNPGPVSGGAVCDGSAPTKVVPITSSTGKIWMDRNLGASRAGLSSTDYQAYGCLYQWGRGNDGHAGITWTSATTGTPLSGTTNAQSATDSPGDDLFVTDAFDWRAAQNDLLWQGVSGVNNPCPEGYRLPTDAELTSEVAANGITDAASAYGSIFKFVSSGYRNGIVGVLSNAGTDSAYWSSTVSGSYVLLRYFDSFTGTGSDIDVRTIGVNVRCVKN